MRNVLVLIMVLGGLVSLANAGTISMSMDATSVTISGQGFTAYAGQSFFLTSIGSNLNTFTAVYPTNVGQMVAPADAEFFPIFNDAIAAYTSMPGGTIVDADHAKLIAFANTGGVLLNGPLVRFTLEPNSWPYWDQIFLHSFEDGSVLQAITYVPEPTTLTIFGLGALMLKRKK